MYVNLWLVDGINLNVRIVGKPLVNQLDATILRPSVAWNNIHSLISKVSEHILLVMLCRHESTVSYALKHFNSQLFFDRLKQLWVGVNIRVSLDGVAQLLRCRTELPLWITKHSPLSMCIPIGPFSENRYILILIYCRPNAEEVSSSSRVNDLVNCVRLCCDLWNRFNYVDVCREQREDRRHRLDWNAVCPCQYFLPRAMSKLLGDPFISAEGIELRVKVNDASVLRRAVLHDWNLLTVEQFSRSSLLRLSVLQKLGNKWRVAINRSKRKNHLSVPSSKTEAHCLNQVAVF